MGRVFFAILTICIISCSNRDKTVDKEGLYESDFRLFQETPVWDLAKSVQDQNVNEIRRIIKEGTVDVDFQESKYGNTLLMLAVKNQKYQASEVLLKYGANPNKPNKYDGSSAILDASAINTIIGSNTKFLELLLAYGGNPNYEEVGERKKDIHTRETPLIVACGYVDNITKSPIDKVKLLVESGADINYRNEFNQFALKEALVLDNYDVVLYLLENGADYSQVIIDRSKYSKGGGKLYIADILREKLLLLGSEEYELKMKIVSFLKKQGVEYRQIPIPASVKAKAKKKYPKNWEEYLERY